MPAARDGGTSWRFAENACRPNVARRARAHAGEVARRITTYLASVQERACARPKSPRAEAQVKAEQERPRAEGRNGIIAAGRRGAFSVFLFGASACGCNSSKPPGALGITAALDETQHLAAGPPRPAGRRAPSRAVAQRATVIGSGWLASAQEAWKAGRCAGPPGVGSLLSQGLRDPAGDPWPRSCKSDERERRLVFALDKIRLESANLVEGQILPPARAAPKVSQALAEGGYEIESGGRGSQRDRRSASAVQRFGLPLVAALDFWAGATRDFGAARRECSRSPGRSDADAWRDRLRRPGALERQGASRPPWPPRLISASNRPNC